ncbi:glycosyltransferase family 2 protein [Desulfococcaceae bacterium HSG8]|nr:glycosyltransferase family 2 protein [Desulfococcaceae bacterium HSG8]
MIIVLLWLFILAILYTYFGYPALLTLLARLRPEPEPFPRLIPSVTLLVPAYNEEAVITQKVENSLNLDYPDEKFQVIVISDGSDDRTADIVLGYADQGIELSHSDERLGKMGAIQRAIPLVRGEIIVFTDATNFFEPNAIQELVLPFADPSVGVVTGAKSIIQGDGAMGASEGFYWKYESFILRQENRLGCCTAASGDSMAIRREIYDAGDTDVFTEDFHMAMRVIRRGYRVIHAPKVPSYERVSISAKYEKERRARIVAGRYQAIFMAHKLLPPDRPLVAWQIISHKFMRPLVPLFMIGALLSNLLIAAKPEAPKIYEILLYFQFIFYAAALIGNFVKTSDAFGKLLYLPTFLVNSNIAALMGLYRFLTKQQTVLWKRVPRREEDALNREK